MPRAAAAREIPSGTKVTVETAAGPQAVPSAPAADPVDLWSYMGKLNPKDWDDHIAYLYREDPKAFLQKFSRTFDIDEVKRTYGGRHFSVLLKKGGNIVKSADFRIEADPIYLPSEIRPNGAPAPATDAGSPLVKEFIGVLREELQRSREANGGNPAGNEAAMKMVVDASSRAIDIVRSQVPGASSAATELVAMVTALKELGIVGGQPQGNSIQDKLLTALIDRALTPQDPMAQLTMFMTLFEKMDALRGGARAGSGGVLGVIAEVGGKLVDHVPGLLGELAARREADVTVARSKERTVELLRGQVPPNAVPVAPAAPGAPRPAVAPAPGGGLRTVPLDGSQPVDTTVSPTPAPPADPGAPPVFQASITADPAYPVVVKLRVCELLEDAPDPDAPEEEQDRQTAEDIVTYLDLAMPGFSQQLVQHSVELTTQAMRGDEIMVRAVNNPRWPRVFQAAREFIKGGDEEKPARRRVM